MKNRIEKITFASTELKGVEFDVYIGDKFIIEHGANQHGKGKALFELTKITKNKNLYGLKTSLDGKRIFNKNHKLNTDTLIRPA
tara:strand:- start:84 stop:335 length:252 start_codon:yes stop_codon:yes gene_type:complete